VLNDGKFYTVVWTWRGGRARIISFQEGARWRRKSVPCDIPLKNAGEASAGESQSDWARAAAMSEGEIVAGGRRGSEEARHDNRLEPSGRSTCRSRRPSSNMRVDRDVLEFFRRDGRGYQTKINAVLRSYVDQMVHRKRG